MTPKFPSGICAKAVAKNHNAVCCDICNLWVHTGLQISVGHRTMTDRNKCLTDLKLFQSDIIVSERKIKT